jgi:hypothetical protein
MNKIYREALPPKQVMNYSDKNIVVHFQTQIKKENSE